MNTKYTKEQLIFYLNKLAKELKRSPKCHEIKHPSSQTFLRRFGSWNNALNSAGLRINVKNKYQKEELLENIRILAKELQRVPIPKDLKGKKWAGSYATYKKYFGKWSNALRQADLEISSSTKSLNTYSKKK
jgi:hypothetical protein